ncbi:cytochrome P450 family protein [Pseudonocardia spinosispora]|uniref:cytochrome P450 family protein n=1 Tax=Pseudonocardia spinosispora TaxID=103441 RepID=UPI00041F8D68|nr:cytochrome P450 [Pseudonocardia spinosispora]
MTELDVPRALEPSPFFLARSPYERHRQYRELNRRGPVHRVVLPHGAQVWLVTGYEHARAALTDPRLATTEPLFAEQLPPALRSAVESQMLNMDPPEHTRLRKLVTAAFTRRRVDGLAPRVQQLADELLEPLVGRAEAGFDLISEFTYPLPIAVICELLGVPPDGRDGFRQWTSALVNATVLGADALVEANAGMVEHLRALIDQKRARPADDLVSALVAARDGGDRLSEDELTSMLHLLIVAGHETTANLIANEVRALLTTPGAWSRLVAEPERVPTVVEEALRFDGPIQTTPQRRAREDFELGGVPITGGDMVLIGLLAANHDTEAIPDADRFDPVREPVSHLAFGHGIHFCLGAPLARLEARVGLSSLLARFPRLCLAAPEEEIVTAPGVLMNAMESLPVTVH